MSYVVDGEPGQYEVLTDSDVQLMFERSEKFKEVEMFIQTDDVAPLVVAYSQTKKINKYVWSDDIDELYEPPRQFQTEPPPDRTMPFRYRRSKLPTRRKEHP